jgi:hypothetical protein
MPFPAINDNVIVPLPQREAKFVNAIEFLDNAIQVLNRDFPGVYYNTTPRGEYPLFAGYERKIFRHLPGRGNRVGLGGWNDVKPSRAASAGDPGHDPCKYILDPISWGFDAVLQKGFERARNTPYICLKDFRFQWEIAQQIEAAYKSMYNIQMDEWETFFREFHSFFAGAVSHQYVLAGGRFDSHRFAYNPMVADADGDYVAVIPGGADLNMSAMVWEPMQQLARKMIMSAPKTAIAEVGGRPVFQAMMDLEDFDEIIMKDSQVREDWRYFNSSVLIGPYGQVQAYKQYAFMHDQASPRYKIKSVDASGNLTLKRVNPDVETEENVVTGTRTDVNPDYLTAEFGVIKIVPRDFYTAEIPPAGPTSLGGGTSFGPTPGYNGQWEWKNIEHVTENLRKEKGFYLWVGEVHPKPETHYDRAYELLYVRTAGYKVRKQSVIDSTSAAVGTLVADSVAEGDNVIVELDEILDAGPGARVTLSAGSTGVVTIADASAAPTYVLTSSGTLTAGTIVTGVTVTVA